MVGGDEMGERVETDVRDRFGGCVLVGRSGIDMRGREVMVVGADKLVVGKGGKMGVKVVGGEGVWDIWVLGSSGGLWLLGMFGM